MRFRFTIRDLLWLVVVAALAVAWWVDRRAIGIQRDEARTAVKQLEGRKTSLEKSLAVTQQQLKFKVDDERAAATKASPSKKP
jgi:hypothetical protein